MAVKTVFITGVGPSGIGLALAKQFHLRGHKVIASGLSTDLLKPAAELGLATVVMDVTSAASIEQAVQRVREMTSGGVDVLINNAGRLHVLPLADTSVEAARAVFEVNVIGVVAVTKAFLPLLLLAAGDDENDAVVANLGSINSVLCPPFHSLYNASKAAVEALGHSIRTELAPLGVRVVTLKTGSVDTRLFDNAPSRVPAGSLYAAIGDAIDGRRFREGVPVTDPDEYARYVVPRLLRRPVSKVIWCGGLATLVWFLSFFSWWVGMLDTAMIRGNGLHKIKRPSKTASHKEE